MAKINKWKDSEAKEDDFVQDIEDLYSGRTQEKVVEEGEEVTPEPITTSVPVSDETKQQKNLQQKYLLLLALLFRKQKQNRQMKIA